MTGQIDRLKPKENGPEIFPGCPDCLKNLASAAAGLAAPDHRLLRAEAEAAAQAVLQDYSSGRINRLTSPELANQMQRAVRRITGCDDPYASIKAKEMPLAGQIAGTVATLAGRDLKGALTLAVLGNSLDFFLPVEEALTGIRTVRNPH